MDFSQFVKGDFLDLYSKTINISELVSFLQSNLIPIPITWQTYGQ